MKKIKVFTDFANCEETLNRIINSYDWKSDCKYGCEYIFTKDDDYTHAILMNFVKPTLLIDKENIIGLAQEPSIYLCLQRNDNLYYYKKVKKYFIGSTKNYLQYSGLPFIEKMSYQLPHISYKIINNYIENFPKKNKLINYVYSHKQWSMKDKNTGKELLLYGYRYELGNTILQNNIPVDIYGGSTNMLKKMFKNNENIKYGFDWKEINKIYENYKFSIVIENTREPEYFSEKIFIPLLCGCIPIYLGSTNIDNYFKDYVIHLSGNINDDFNLIKNIINNPYKYYKKINIEEIKEKIHLKNIIHQEFL